MDEFINIKKWLIIFAIFIAATVYIRKNYGYEDVLKYSKENPHSEWSPKIDYYVGMAYYMRDDYPEARGAFDQLLTGYPTSQYAPKALLRKGTIEMSMRKWGDARRSFETYMKEWPEGGDMDKVKKKYEFIKFK